MEKVKQMQIIKRPIITEKTMALVSDRRTYTFEVSKKANKIEIKHAVEFLFNVEVVAVRTINVLPKKRTVGKYTGFRSGYKKAMVTVAEGNKIEAFEL